MSAKGKGKGHRDTPEHRARAFGAPHPMSAAAPVPAACALRSFLPPSPFDQGDTMTCFAHAQAALIVLACAKAGSPLGFVPSPLGIARNTYCEEQPLAAGELLVDTGADMGDVMTACAREGIFPIGALSPDGRYSDVTPANVALRPTLADDERGARELVFGPQQIQPTATDFLAQCRDALANLGCGVSIGLHSTPVLERWFDAPPRDAQGNFVPLADASGITATDGHDVVLADYREDGAFWVRSSWGSGGDDGGIWIAGSTLVALTVEAWRMQVRVAEASS